MKVGQDDKAVPMRRKRDRGLPGDARPETYRRPLLGRPFTPRENEIFDLTTEGLRPYEMAERLVLSPSTIDTHRRNLMIKLGARTMAHAVFLKVTRPPDDEHRHCYEEWHACWTLTPEEQARPREGSR